MPFPAVINVTELNGTNGFMINGSIPNGLLGRSVNGACDVNGDAIDDFVVSAPGQEVIYIIFGSTTDFQNLIETSNFNEKEGSIINGTSIGGFAGWSVTCAGDINDDGIDDILIGAPFIHNGYNQGKAYIIYGDRNSFPSTINLTDLQNHGFTIEGQQSFAASDFGYSVSGIGDFNGDGYSDFTVSAPFTILGNNDEVGKVFVVFGQDSFNSLLDINTLTEPNNGFIFSGNITYGYAGFSIHGAGDINGDGLNDLLIGANAFNTTLNPNFPGAVYVIFGSRNYTNIPTNAALINGNNGFTVYGAADGDLTGYSVSTAGDINGDGIDDIIIGAPHASSGDGNAYVIFGKRDTFTISLSLKNLTSDTGFTIPAIPMNSYTGISVSGVGDVNSDGINDIIIGAINLNANIGGSYIIFGSRNGFNLTVNLAHLNGSNGFAVNELPENGFGAVVSNAGDVNGDGVDDILIGVPGAYNHTGATYVIFGQAPEPTAICSTSFELSNLDGTNGFILNGTIKGYGYGHTVSGAGDVNNDGISDLLVGVSQYPNHTLPSNAYVVFGTAKGFSPYINLNELNGTDGFIMVSTPGDAAGVSVSGAGDINGDGIDDVLIGAFAAGKAYVVYGKASKFFPNIDYTNMSASQGFTIIGYQGDLGIAVSGIGSINGDNIPDIAIGSIYNQNKVYVLYGSFGNFSSMHLIPLNETQGFVINGVLPNDQTGFAVSSAGDINGDGINDLIIGSTATQSFAGASQVIFGQRNQFPFNFNLINLNGTNGFTLQGVAEQQSTGYSVSGLGDINGDGYDDVIIGALSVPEAPGTEGSYVIFGHAGDFLPVLNTSSINGTNGFTILGAGYSVSGSGDVNGDGINDIVLGSYGVFSTYLTGKTYVLYGNRQGFPPIVDLTAINASQGYSINGIPGDNAGSSVAIAGDINGDGIDDIIIGDSYQNSSGLVPKQPFSTSGVTYIVFGKRCISSSSSPTPSITPSLPPSLNPTPPFSPSSSSSNSNTLITLLIAAGGFFFLVLVLGAYAYRSYRSRYEFDELEDLDDEEKQENVKAPLLKQEHNHSLSYSSNAFELSRLVGDEFVVMPESDSVPLYETALSLRKGIGRKRDTEQAARLFLEAASNDDGPAAYQLGRVHEKREMGSLNRQDYLEHLNQAHKYYQLAVKLGVKKASYRLQKVQVELQGLRDNSLEQAIAFFEQQASQGHKEAQECLGHLYENLLPTPDYERAFHGYKAAFADNPQALTRIQLRLYGKQARQADDKHQVDEALRLLTLAQQLDTTNRTLLHLAAYFECKGCIEQLLQEKVDVTQKDSQGKTAYDIAIEGNNPYIISALSEAVEFQQRLAKTEENFQQLLQRLRLERARQNAANEEELYLIEARDLHQRILDITEPDVLSLAVDTLKKQLQKPDVFDYSSKTNLQVKELLQKIHSPANLFMLHSTSLSDTKRVISHTCKNIEALIYDIQKLVKGLPHTHTYQALISELDLIQSYYRQFMEQVQRISSNRQRKALFELKASIHGARLNFRYLSAEATQQLVVAEDAKNRQQQYGIHIVREYNGVHYKINPYAPGVEYMVNSLAQLVAGQGTPPTELLKVVHTEHAHAYLASKTVVGVNLEHLLLKHPELIDKIDSYNFSGLFILGLLTDPQDGKADNYMARVSLDNQGEIERITLVGIDNDIAFADPIVRQHRGEKAGQHYVNVKNILYFFPQMNQPLDETFKEQFLANSPEVLVVLWLASLAKKNEAYAELVKQKVLSPEQLEELKLPIKLVPGMALKLCQKMQQIQEAIRMNPQLTHQALFKAIEPYLQHYYQKTLQQHPNPWDALFKLYSQSAPSVEDMVGLSLHLSRYSFMTSLAHQNAKFDDFELKRAQDIQTAMEEFITTLNLDLAERAEQKSVVAYIGSLYLIEHLTLTNDSILTKIALSELAGKFPSLTTLTLKGCKQVTAKEVLNALLTYPSLTVHLEDCIKINKATDWLRIARECQNFILVVEGDEYPIHKEAAEDLINRYTTNACKSEELKSFLLELVTQQASAKKQKDSPIHRSSSQAQANASSETSRFLQRQQQHHLKSSQEVSSSSALSVKTAANDNTHLSFKGAGKK